MFTEHERYRLKGGMLLRNLSTYDWRAYFTYLLGRDVSVRETDEFLIAEAQGVSCNELLRTV